MKIPNLQIPLIGLYCLINSFVCAQEPLNSAIAFASLSRNPALAGIEVSDLQFNLCFHQQNQTVLVPYQTFQVQILSRYRKNESEDGFTAGAMIRQDVAGENHLTRKQLQPVINFHKSLSDVKFSYLSLGLMTNIVETKFDLSKIPNTDQIKTISLNQASPSIEQTLNSINNSYFDFNIGASFFTDLNNFISLYMGAALFHFGQDLLVNPNINPHPLKEFVLNTGIAYQANNFSVQVLSDLRIRNNGSDFYSGLLYGIPIGKNVETKTAELQLGFYYNSKKELSPIISFNWPCLNLSVCYDIYLGNPKEIKIFTNTFELNASFNINCHKRNKESEKMKCQKFR